MALECQEIVDSNNNAGKINNNSYTDLESALQFSVKKVGLKLEGCNGVRSIVDLPHALVSEILHCLDPKDLGIVSCVSNLLNGLATDNIGWKDFYCKRWGAPLGPALPPPGSWKELFVERELRSKSFMGHFTVEALRGHSEAVRAVFLLQALKLVFTGGYDSVVRMWDMEEGLAIATSRHLGNTIRAIAADTELLVVGGTNGFIQCWRAIEGNPHLFDIAVGAVNQNTEFRLWGHEGPITCIALDSVRIFSGSWDMSVRIWDRAQMKCLNVLRHSDWVWALVPRGSSVASTAGGDAYIWDIEKGNLTTVIRNTHVGNAHALARSHVGDLLFTGGEDGSIHMFDVANYSGEDNFKPVATWTPHSGPVLSLAFEFPWLVSSASDGRIALVNVGKLLGSGQHSSFKHRVVVKRLTPRGVEPPQRMLHGFASNLFSVAIGGDRIVCGGEEGVVRVWDFSQALEIEKRVRALRGTRLENRMRRRKVQIEINAKGGRADQGSPAARNQNRSGIWRVKRGRDFFGHGGFLEGFVPEPRLSVPNQGVFLEGFVAEPRLSAGH